MSDPESSLEAAIDGVVASAAGDPRGALFLCAWLSNRAQLYAEPTRSRLLDRLAVLAVGADADAIAAAARYAELRAALVDFHARAAAPTRTMSPADVDIHIGRAHRFGRARAALPIVLVVSLLVLVLGLSIAGGTCGSVMALPGIVVLVFYRPASFILRGLENDAVHWITQSAEIDALEAMARSAAADRDRLVSGPGGEWLRAEIEARPALAFAEFVTTTTTAYR